MAARIIEVGDFILNRFWGKRLLCLKGPIFTVIIVWLKTFLYLNIFRSLTRWLPYVLFSIQCVWRYNNFLFKLFKKMCATFFNLTKGLPTCTTGGQIGVNALMQHLRIIKGRKRKFLIIRMLINYKVYSTLWLRKWIGLTLLVKPSKGLQKLFVSRT